MLKIGIVGLPNVGKSLLFNAITNSSVESSNYPFTTIKPNIKIIDIKDQRIDFLAEKFHSKKRIYPQIQYYDIAGLIKNAAKGEGLGNKFLSNIREVDGIIHLLRGFDEKAVIHVDQTIDIIRDLEVINLELILADLEQVNRWLEKNQKKAEFSSDKFLVFSLKTFLKTKEILVKEQMLNSIIFEKEELKVLKNFNFLTNKTILYVINISEKDLNYKETGKFQEIINYFLNHNLQYKIVSVKLEEEISSLEENEANIFLEEYNLKESGLNLLSKEIYNLLNYQIFFTSGPKETRGWEITKGSKAPDAAGVIHSDFKRGFIRAEVYNFQDFFNFSDENILKSKGLIRSEGKNYVLQDGDICIFKFNV